ncbi:MAG: hypothetical protein JW774_03510 [Candidatus Aureabacteria bacterium]|nr:hypothetical protein [Candidatus Auribacterota bacterium]
MKTLLRLIVLLSCIISSEAGQNNYLAPISFTKLNHADNDVEIHRFNNWLTLEDSIKNIQKAFEINRPDIIERYTHLDKLSADELALLTDDIYQLSHGHFKIWNIGSALHPKVRFFNGSYINALIAVFPKLNLNPFGFRLNWSTRDTAIESIQYVFNKHIPEILEKYRRLDELKEEEIERLKERIYGISFAHFSMWGLASTTDQRKTPYFDGTFAGVMQAVFPRLNLHPLGFQLDGTSREKKLESIKFVLEKKIPEIFRKYRRLSELSAARIERLKNEIYAITGAQYNIWGLHAMHFGNTYVDALCAIFPDLELDPLGFKLNWSSEAMAIQSIRFVLKRERPGLVETYDSIDSISDGEISSLKERIYSITSYHFQIWNLSSAMNTRHAPYFNGSYVSALHRVFSNPKLSFDENEFMKNRHSQWEMKYSWTQGLEACIANVRDAIQENKPDLLSRYAKLDSLPAEEAEELKDDIYQITYGHFGIWGIASATHKDHVPYFQGSIVVALQYVFPRLHLNPLGFQLNWSNYETSLESIRYVLWKQRPDLMNKYEHYTSLSIEERNDLIADIYKIGSDEFMLWGISNLDFFEGSYIPALQAVFPDLKLNPLGFRLDYSTKERVKASLEYSLRKNIPQVLEAYDRIEELSPAKIEVLRRNVYKITAAHFQIWHLGDILTRDTAPEYEGSYISVLQDFFPELHLNRLGFQLDWSDKDKAIASIRFVLSKEIPELIKSYDSRATLKPAELERLKKNIYSISYGHFKLWGLSGAANRENSPYFNGSFINALMEVFPDIGLEKAGFGLDWSSLTSAVESIRFKLLETAPELMESYSRIESMPPDLLDALRNDIYAIGPQKIRDWGLKMSLDPKSAPYFNGDFRDVLMQTFNHPLLALDKNRFLKKSRNVLKPKEVETSP